MGAVRRLGMFGVLAALTLIAIGLALRAYQKRCDNALKMSRGWVLDVLPDHVKEQRKRMGHR